MSRSTAEHLQHHPTLAREQPLRRALSNSRRLRLRRAREAREAQELREAEYPSASEDDGSDQPHGGGDLDLGGPSHLTRRVSAFTEDFTRSFVADSYGSSVPKRVSSFVEDFSDERQDNGRQESSSAPPPPPTPPPTKLHFTSSPPGNPLDIMAELRNVKISPESHFLLDQPLLRLPYELSRNNFRTAHRQLEQNQTKVLELIDAGVANAALDPSGAATVANLDDAIARLKKLKRKLEALDEVQNALSNQLGARIEHMDQLYHIPTLADVAYEDWSKVRLNRLLVDYLCRSGYTKSARELAESKDILALVDLEEWEAVGKIDQSLREERRVDLVLAWCGENKANLKKISNNLEYELRLQQHIELIRTGQDDKLHEAIQHARKYLAVQPSRRDPFGFRSAGLLAYDPDTSEQSYTDLFSMDRWDYLAECFLETHHALFSLPSQPLLHIALSAGLSALKTPACHSKFVSPTSGLNSSRSPPHHSFDYNSLESETSGSEEPNRPTINPSLATHVCPICSTELNQLATHVPYAHHSKSHVENDPVVLPNGRIYGRERLIKLNEKLGSPEGLVRDPVEPDKFFEWTQVRKVFIS